MAGTAGGRELGRGVHEQDGRGHQRPGQGRAALATAVRARPGGLGRRPVRGGGTIGSGVTDNHVTAGGPAAGDDDGSAAFIALRPRLLGIAYRLAGSMLDAQDLVAAPTGP